MLQSNRMPSQTGNREKLAGARVSAVRLRRLLNLLSGAAPGRHERVGGERVGTERTKARFEDSSSLYLAPGDSPDRAALAATGWDRPLAELGDTALGDGCGLVGIRCGDRGLLVSPPYPVKETYLSTDWDDELLREILNGDYTVGVVLVRLGRFSVAVFRGGELVEAKTDSRYVKGRHHAGGTSQLRYTRVREGQIRRLYGKVCEEVRARLLSPGVRLDHVALGGERFTLNGLLKDCQALAALQPITLKRRLNIRDPKRDTLPQVAGMLTESRVWELEFD